MTTGCKKISAANLKLIHKVTLINFLIGWSGFSVHSQALSFISNTDINGKLYIFIKLIHGSLSAVYTILLYNFIYKDLISPSFYPYYYPMDPIFILEWPNLLLNSIKLALLMTLYLLISSLIVFYPMLCIFGIIIPPLILAYFHLVFLLIFLNPPGYLLIYYQHIPKLLI